MTRLDAAKARACAGMRAGRARVRAALLALRRMPRGYLEARGEFACNLAERATIFLIEGRTVSSMQARERQKKRERELLTMCGIVRYVSEVSGIPKEKSPIPVCRFGSHFQRR